MVQIQVIQTKVEEYNKLGFHTTDNRWLAEFKEDDVKEIGEAILKKAVRGHEYMAYAVNSVMKKLKFVPYSDSESYKPTDFDNLGEIVIAVIQKIKELTEFEDKVSIGGVQSKLGSIEPNKEGEEEQTD